MSRVVRFAVACAVAASAVAAPHPASAARVCPPPVPAVAHRGGAERYTENSRAAFRDAGNIGVLWWETDVRWTADGVPVLMHDETVDRTTDGTGAVASMTLAQVRALRLDSGEPVPTLEELARDAEVDGATVMVEPKTAPTAAQWASFWRTVGGQRASVVVTSFDPAVTAAAARAGAAATGLIEATGYRTAASLAPYGIAWYVKHQWSVTGARLVEWSGPYRVAAWTVDTPADWQRMNTYTAEPGRLDAVITNRPRAYLAWARARVC